MNKNNLAELKSALSPEDLSLILASRMRNAFNHFDMSINEWRQISAFLVGTSMVTVDTMFDLEAFERVESIKPMTGPEGQA